MIRVVSALFPGDAVGSVRLKEDSSRLEAEVHRIGAEYSHNALWSSSSSSSSPSVASSSSSQH